LIDIMDNKGVVKMSGGSHNYLYSKDEYDLFSWGSVRDLDNMASSMIEYGAIDIAKDTLRLKNYIEQALTKVEVMQESLSKVFKAVEWCDSGDTGKDSLQKAFEEYRNK